MVKPGGAGLWVCSWQVCSDMVFGMKGLSDKCLVYDKNKVRGIGCRTCSRSGIERGETRSGAIRLEKSGPHEIAICLRRVSVLSAERVGDLDVCGGGGNGDGLAPGVCLGGKRGFLDKGGRVSHIACGVIETVGYAGSVGGGDPGGDLVVGLLVDGGGLDAGELVVGHDRGGAHDRKAKHDLNEGDASI